MDLIWKINHGIVVYGKITPDKFISISVPDKFELLQINALERGKNIGDLIPDTYSIEPEIQDQSSLSVVNKKQNIITRIMNRIKGKKKELNEMRPSSNSNIEVRRNSSC